MLSQQVIKELTSNSKTNIISKDTVETFGQKPESPRYNFPHHRDYKEDLEVQINKEVRDAPYQTKHGSQIM